MFGFGPPPPGRGHGGMPMPGPHGMHGGMYGAHGRGFGFFGFLPFFRGRHSNTAAGITNEEGKSHYMEDADIVDYYDGCGRHERRVVYHERDD